MNIGIPSATLIRRLQEEREARAAAVLKGALSHEDYKNVTGFIRGLDHCIAEIEDLARVQRNDDD